MENVYILAMEYGYKHRKGFNYPELLKHIETELDEKLNKDAEYALVDWFFDSFKSAQDLGLHHRTVILEAIKNEREVDYFVNATWVIKGQTTKQYVDYLELKESRENSKKAFRTSLWSIGIALITLLVSTYFAYKTPIPASPPYDVKIIEDNTSTKELEKEVKDLKEKLYKAELLIDVYETD